MSPGKTGRAGMRKEEEYDKEEREASRGNIKKVIKGRDYGG